MKVTSWCGKIQTDFLFSKIVFLMYREIYVHVFASNSLHSILACVWCQKWTNIDSNSMLRDSALVISILVDPRGMVQPIAHKLVHRKKDGSTHTMWYTSVKVKVTSVHKLMWKITNSFFVFQDRIIPDV